METLLYELKPYACMAIGIFSLTGHGAVLNLAGFTLVVLGAVIYKMRRDYRREARHRM